MLRHPVCKGIVSRGEVVSSEEYIRNIDEMIRIVRSRNSDVRILLWGTTLAFNSPERNDNIRRYNALLKEAANSLGVLYLDIEDIVSSLPTSEAYLDDVHLSAKCSTLIAEAMFQLLKQDRKS